LKVSAQFLIDQYKVSKRKACLAIKLNRGTFDYILRTRDDTAIRARIKEIAAVRIRYGEERIYKLLRREGWPDNHKRVRRIYREERLNLRLKRPKKPKASATRIMRDVPAAVHECWAMDFVHDQLFDGKKIRALTVVDIFSRFCLAINVQKSFSCSSVAHVMERLKNQYGCKPKTIRLDNGPEFIGKELNSWAEFNNVTLDFSRKGKPTDNAFCESFNGTLRDECLNTTWFMSLEDAVQKIEAWRIEYNTFRQHSSINDLTPDDMMKKHQQKP